ncbi:MAG: hypothetical protein WCX82_00115 [archaeon]|jgi:oligoribonuclease NrnB/cAMP/cGMP phosphodiesterase (DHH superfamily)
MKTIIFHHDDIDGLISALGFAYNDYTTKNPGEIPDYKELRKNYFFFEVHYGMSDIFSYCRKNHFNLNGFERVIVVDFCFKKEVMQEFSDTYKNNFIWIDHHKNVIDEFSDLEIKGLRNHNFAASVLVWKYFNKEPCLFAQYIEDMDIWKWQLPNSREILQYLDYLYMQIFDKDHPENENKIINDFLDFFDDNKFKNQLPEFINLGKMMELYIKIRVKDDVITGKTFDFEGVKTFVVNSQFKAGLFSDYIFNNSNYNDVELVIVWYKSYAKYGEGNNFDKVSLRSRNIDCSPIAQKFGGNGHPKASGFIISDIDDIIQ